MEPFERVGVEHPQIHQHLVKNGRIAEKDVL